MVFTDEMLARAAYEVDMAILASLPDEKECNHTFTPAFERKMQKLVKRVDHPFVYQTLRRAACFLVAFFLTASLILAFNPEARAAILDWVQDKFNEFYHYFYIGADEGPEPSDPNGFTTPSESGDSNDPSEPDGTKDPIASTGSSKSVSYSLGWLPDGFMLLDSGDSPNGKTFIYLSDSGQMVQFMYMYGSDSNSIFTGVGEYEQKHVSVGDLNAEILLSLDDVQTNVIVWSGDNENVMFCITGFLVEDVLIKMAQNLLIVNNN